MTTHLFDVHEPLRKSVDTIELPLDNFKESSSFDVNNATAGAADGSGGILASDTTPVRDAINAATDGCQRIIWTNTDVQEITTQAVLPMDFDPTKNLVFHARVVSGGTTNAVGFTVDSFYNESDSIVTDTSTTNQTATYAEITATISKGDIPAGAQTISIRLTPVSHGTDTMAMSACWLEYTPKFPLEASGGLYCCMKTVRFPHKVLTASMTAQNVTTTGTVTVTLRHRDINEARSGTAMATALNNVDLGDKTNVNTRFDFVLTDTDKGVAPKDRTYFIIVTGTSQEDRIEEPCLLLEVTDDLL